MAFTMSMSGRRCPVFFGGMRHGHNIFTAQCSHTASVTPALSSVYDDDDYEEEEPAEPLAADAAGNGVLVLRTHLEYPAIPNDAAHDGFAVVVTVKAPAQAAPEAGRAPLDLVTVLDVSGSMAGDKLDLVKRAMGFVIDRLGPRDRLSVVAFSDDARRVTRLTRMSEDGKDATKRAVESLVAAGSGSANVRGGLDEAAKVLNGSRHKNDVVGVILLSDGQDYKSSDHSVLVPPFLRTLDYRRTPVHTFGFGSDHDAAAMHHISEVTGGTFSFIENHAVIQDAFAQCVGGLLSLAAKGVSIDVDCSYPGVRVRAVKSGCYETSIRHWDWDWDWEDQDFTVNVGDLYADEERRFLLLLDLERADHANNTGTTHLMKLSCDYWDTATRQEVKVARGPWVLMRPHEVTDVAPSMEIKRELIRVGAAEDMALARSAAERGAYAEAARILDARRESLRRSAPAGDAMCKALVAELHELSLRVSGEREYQQTGRACLLAGMSSHAQQRGSSVRLCRPMSGLEFGCAGSAMFATPAMRKMEKLSEMLRERQEAALARPSPENASRAVLRPRLEARLAAAAPRLSTLRKYRLLVPFKR